VVDELCLGMRKEGVLRRLLLLLEADQTDARQVDLEEDPETDQVVGVLCLEVGVLDV